VVVPTKSKTVIPVHFDNIFTPLSQKPENMRGINMSEFYRTAKEDYAGVRIKTMKIGESFKLNNL